MNADVIIVGAGPTGLLLGNLLGAMGVQTVIVERNNSTVDAPRAVSIDDESVRALQAVGLSDALIVQKGYGSIYKGPTGRVFATVKPSARTFGFDKRNAFQQPELESMLREGIGRFPNVNIKFGCELVAVVQTETKVTATVKSGSMLQSIEGTYLVACDGGRSPTRKLLDISMEGSTFAEPWLIVDLKSTRNRCFHTEVFCNPKRPCITLPGPKGIRRYEFKLAAGETAEIAEEENFARNLLAEFGPDQNEPIVRKQIYTFHARIAERWRVGRIFLAGDAAHLTPPFAGQGLNSGLRDAHNLAWKLDEALKTSAQDELLDSYQTERKPHAKAMIELALRMGKVMMPTSQLNGRMVRAAFHILGLIPAARDYFAHMKYKPKPRFKAGLIVNDGVHAKKTIVGSLIPQPLVEISNGQIQLLDTLLLDKPTLLIFAERPENLLSKEIASTLIAQGIGIFGLTPEWTKAYISHIPTGRDVNGHFSEQLYLRYLNHFILLRRDRYVAGTMSADRLDDLENIVNILKPNTRINMTSPRN